MFGIGKFIESERRSAVAYDQSSCGYGMGMGGDDLTDKEFWGSDKKMVVMLHNSENKLKSTKLNTLNG